MRPMVTRICCMSAAMPGREATCWRISPTSRAKEAMSVCILPILLDMALISVVIWLIWEVMSCMSLTM